MVDILILFQEDGEEVATRLAWAAAERGYSVWGDPGHFTSGPDEELEAATRAARCVMLLWSKGMVADAAKKAEIYAKMDPKRVCAATLSPGLEPPEPWRSRPSDDLSRIAQSPQALTVYLDRALRAAGAPSDKRERMAAVDRLREAEEDAAAWRAIRGMSGTEAYDAYLRRFGHGGLFAALAKRKKLAAAPKTAAVPAPAKAAPAVKTQAPEAPKPKAPAAVAERKGGGRSPVLLVASGAAAASIVFGGLTLMTGGDLRRLDGGPTQEALALQNAEEMGADLSAELNETRQELARARRSLETRNAAIAEMEIALADAEAIAAQSGAGASEREAAAKRARADLQDRLAEAARGRADLEKTIAEQERALRTMASRLRRAETDLAQSRDARSKSEAERAEEAAELQAAFEASQSEVRRANTILSAARRRIEALEAERSELRAAATESGADDGAVNSSAGVRQLPARLATQQEEQEPQAAPTEVARAALPAHTPDPDSAAPASAPLPKRRP
ncbi:MAG: TIR domain-containing protein [Pseudomonadota bacterium]